MTLGRNDRYFGLAAGKDEQSDSHLLRFCRTDSVRSSTRMRQNHKQNHLGRPDSVWGASSERREKITCDRNHLAAAKSGDGGKDQARASCPGAYRVLLTSGLRLTRGRA
jgi:hypothetical protein